MNGTPSIIELGILLAYGALSLASIPYAVHAFLMAVLRPRNRLTADASPPPEEWPAVTVQLPIYNERYVVHDLLKAICALDYPSSKLEIQVLDDSTDDTREILAGLVERYREQDVDIVHLHRVERAGYKAGALKEGLEVAKGEFVAIFDADFLPSPDFLRRTVPSFKPGVAFVQARWGHLNHAYSPLTRMSAIAIDAHFVLESGVRHARNLLIQFNGTCGVWRKAAIIDAGNWDGSTLTEDLDIALRAQLGGWQTVYLNDVVCEGELPPDLASVKVQQCRWAKGYIQNSRKHLWGVLRTSQLSVFTRLEAAFLLLSHVIFPISLLLLILALPTAYVAANLGFTGSGIGAAAIPWIGLMAGYPLFFAVAQKETYHDWKHRVALVPFLTLFMIGLSVACTKAVLSGLAKGTSPFIRTPKHRIRGKVGGWRQSEYWTKADSTLWLEMGMALYMGASAWYAFRHDLLGWLPWMLMGTVAFTAFSGLGLAQVLRSRRNQTTPDDDPLLRRECPN